MYKKLYILSSVQSLRHVQLFATPRTAAQQASLSITNSQSLIDPQVIYNKKQLLSCFCSVASVMSDSVPPHRRQPTRPRSPWDSPGKNTAVACHFLLQCMKGKSESEVAKLCPTPSDPMDCSPPGSSIHGIFQARVLEWGATAFSENKAELPAILGSRNRLPLMMCFPDNSESNRDSFCLIYLQI